MIERQVAQAILQQPIGKVKLRGKEYPINHPSPATLIMVSEECSRFPHIDPKGNILTEILRTSKDCAVVGKIIAILILGAKRVNEYRMVESTEKRHSRSFLRRFLHLPDKVTTHKRNVAEIDYLAAILLEDFTPSQLGKLTESLFFYSEIADFFGLTTSLSGANLLRSTKEVVTASGE